MKCFLLLVTLSPLFAQTGSVSGKVVNSVTGQVVKRAVVTLQGSNGRYATSCDQSGKFLFENVAPATYMASAQAESYATVTRNASAPVTVAAQQRVEDVEVRIAPLAAISGKVVDDDGQPLVGVSVSARRFIYTAVGKRIQTDGAAQTDDRGMYRIFDLQPGRYYLAVANTRGGAPRPAVGENVRSNVPEEEYASVYYPGVADLSQALLQDLQPGAEWSGANFKLRRYPAYHVRGHVNGAVDPGTGKGGRSFSIMALRCTDDLLSGLEMNSLRVIQNGNRFDLVGAISGTYCLELFGGKGGIVERRQVTVKDGDVNDVELTVPPSFTVNGSVVIEGTPPNPTPQVHIVLLSVTAEGALNGEMKSDGRFQFEGAIAGAYTLSMPQMGPLYVKSVLYGGQDVTSGVIPNLQPDVALTVTMGTDPGEIDGTLQAGNVSAYSPVVVVALPEDAYAARQDMQRVTSGPAGGSFRFPNMPPGNYKLFAMQAEDYADAYNRELTKALDAKATAVTVHAAGREQVSVTAISSDEVEQALRKLK